MREFVTSEKEIDLRKNLSEKIYTRENFKKKLKAERFENEINTRKNCSEKKLIPEKSQKEIDTRKNLKI